MDEPELAETSEDEPERHLELGGDEALSVDETTELVAKYSGELVLVAGEYQCGKTTFVAELYGQFLKGAYCGWKFAGSSTLIALDRRYHGTREASGFKKPKTQRTEDEDMRLLDLRIKSQHLKSLLFSDVRGEFFEHVIDGAPVADEVPLAERCDLLIIQIDGDRVANPKERADVLTRARLLIGGMTEPGGIPDSTPCAIMLAKADSVDSESDAWFDERARPLGAFARERGCSEAVILKTAARPAASPHEPDGLDSAFTWLTQPREALTQVPSATIEPSRSFWQAR